MKDTLTKTLLPWLCYAGISLAGYPLLAALVAFVGLGLACVFLSSGAKPVDYVLMLYFSALAVGIGLFHWAWLVSLQPVIAPAMLAFMAFGTVLLRRPFTLSYARETVKDPVLLESHHFYRVNYILSALWGTAFLIAAVGQALALGKPNVFWMATLSAFIVTSLVAWFTCWFPNWYRKKFYEPYLIHEEVTQ